jgi:hypothetical protein
MRLDEEGLFDLDPIHLRRATDRRKRMNDIWYYEEKYGLHVLCDAARRPLYTLGSPIQGVIPLRKIKEYMNAISHLERGD